MSKVTYLTGPDTTVLDIDPGVTLLVAAVANGVDGIIGECGGNAMCATCHVFVEDGPLTALPPVSAAEEEMLECTAEPRRPTSRLACQITATAELEGLVVRVAEEQL